MPKKSESTYEQLKHRVEALNDKLKDLQGQTTELISENPVKSTLVAFGVGVLLGAVVMKLMEK